MADRIRALQSIGAVQPTPATHAGSPRGAREQEQERQPQRLSAGAPADVVDLSLDPKTVRQLPPTYYLKFHVDRDSGSVIVQVINSATDEVVRQVPSDELHHALNDLA